MWQQNPKPMKILYNIYQICFALPILLVLTILTALVTIIGSLLGGAHIWGYYPGKICIIWRIAGGRFAASLHRVAPTPRTAFSA